MAPSLRHRFRNIAHSVLLIGGMAGIFWVVLSALWGSSAAILALVAIGAMLLFSPMGSADLILTMYRARRIGPEDFPDGVALVEALAERADLNHVPAFYYIPSAVPNAFATGRGENTVIAVSDGLLRLLNRRELAGVLGHEMSHIAHRDLWIMMLADVMTRMTGLISFVGQIMLILNLPLILMGAIHVPWIVPLLLIFSPTIMSLLQLALSRAREFDADLGAARLTGDPVGLASALAKLERVTGRFWEEILLPGRRMPDPSLLRTHPKTQDRIARLRALDPEAFETRPPVEAVPLGVAWPRILVRPRWHRTGMWF